MAKLYNQKSVDGKLTYGNVLYFEIRNKSNNDIFDIIFFPKWELLFGYMLSWLIRISLILYLDNVYIHCLPIFRMSSKDHWQLKMHNAYTAYLISYQNTKRIHSNATGLFTRISVKSKYFWKTLWKLLMRLIPAFRELFWKKMNSGFFISILLINDPYNFHSMIL